MLSADDRAQLLRDVAEMQDDSDVLLMETVCEVWRSPDPVNGKRGPIAEVLSNIAIHIRALKVEGGSRPDPAPIGLSGQRITHLARVLASVDIRIGDEVRANGLRYAVEGSSAKRTLRTLTLNWMKS